MFDQEEWDDDKSGKNLESSLFLGRLPEMQQPVTKGKRKRKRKGKTSPENMDGEHDIIPYKAPRASRKEKVSVVGSTGNSAALEMHYSPVKSSLNACEEVGRSNVNGDSKLVHSKRKDKANGVKQQQKCNAKTETIKVQTAKNLSGKEKPNKIIKSYLESHSILDSLKNANSSHSAKSRMLRERVTSKLQSAHFRFLNEQLYSCQSKEAKALFSGDPKAFQSYHTGYMKQVSKWPVNPLDLIISFLKKRPQQWVIGDFGCGDARLSASVKNKVYSFDLVAFNNRVTVADISDVPLPAESLDVAVFCLSLMGTNYTEFLHEANRTLKPKGLLIIAEVASRFTSISKFVNVLKKLGFNVEKQDRGNTHFCMFHFRKSKSCQNPLDNVPRDLLKPCLYKKR